MHKSCVFQGGRTIGRGTYFGSWLSEMLNSGKWKRGDQFRTKMKFIDCSQFTKRQQIASDVILGRDSNSICPLLKVYAHYSLQTHCSNNTIISGL
jgi:hypothetical protein